MAALRADAQRNRDRVLVAAAEAFAEHGPNVSIDGIARRAGVGHATVFRRFPTKEALIAAVVADRVRELGDLAQTLLAEPDAGAAFDTFVWHVAELQTRDRALFECGPLCTEVPEVIEAKQRLHELLAELVSRAQAEGALRDDVQPDDVPVLIGSAIVAALQAGTPDARQRYVAIVRDGLRPSTRSA
jgi:AcrR family transcriptional regulator